MPRWRCAATISLGIWFAMHRPSDPERAEEILEGARERFASVLLDDGRSVAEWAEAPLFELRHLAIGREVPPLEGKDHAGEALSLESYRGRVVLLPFWAHG